MVSLNKIKSSELEETLLVVPLDVVLDLMQILETLLQSYIFSENTMIQRALFSKERLKKSSRHP